MKLNPETINYILKREILNKEDFLKNFKEEELEVLFFTGIVDENTLKISKEGKRFLKEINPKTDFTFFEMIINKINEKLK